MSQSRYFIRIALRNLRRGGQRAWVALLCVAFGVMSVTAMVSVAGAFGNVISLAPAEMLAADLSVESIDTELLTPAQIAQLDELQASGAIERYTLVAFSSSLTFRLAGSGEMHFASTGMGVDPAVYPLAGQVRLQFPAGASLAELLRAPGDLVITRDLAEQYNLAVGDELVLADLHLGAPVSGVVRGIADDTPNHQGSKVYYTQATGAALENRQEALDIALVNAPSVEAVAGQLSAAGWSVFTSAQAAHGNQDAIELFQTLLKGAGILGLLVGGIGIANTMQVLLQRRRGEIAIWKTLGYTAGELNLLFGIEAALLGSLGSTLGVGAGMLVAQGLVRLFSRSTNLLIAWELAPQPFAVGWLVGLITTLIFALWAVVTASQVRPLALLRNEPVRSGSLPPAQLSLLAMLLAAPFTALVSWVMGSLLKGAGVLLFALGGLVVLGGALGGLAWLAARLFPLGWLPLARIAQNSLRRRGGGLVFALIALFVGIATLALGVVVTENASATMDERRVVIEGYTLRLGASADQQAEVEQALAEAQADGQLSAVVAGWQSAIAAFQTIGRALPEEAHLPAPVLISRSEPGEYAVRGAAWGSQPQGAYSFIGDHIPLGSQFDLTLADGSQTTLTVVGDYEVDWDLPVQLGLLVPGSTLSALPVPDSLTYLVEAPAGQVAQLSARLGSALPAATVLNLVAYRTRFLQANQNLFVLALSMAGLALLAGVLLVANSVSLAMLDRRYEIGVLKAVGYARLHILFTLAVEYSVLALIATLSALAAVQVFLLVVAAINDLAGSLLVLSPLAALGIGVLGVGLVLVTVLAVAWHTTQVAPAAVLNDRA